MDSNSSVSDRRQQGGYSAAVSITLWRDGQPIDVAQVGGERLYFEQPVALQPGEYTLIRTVDGIERSWKINVAGKGVAGDVWSFRTV